MHICVLGFSSLASTVLNSTKSQHGQRIPQWRINIKRESPQCKDYCYMSHIWEIFANLKYGLLKNIFLPDEFIECPYNNQKLALLTQVNWRYSSTAFRDSMIKIKNRIQIKKNEKHLFKPTKILHNSLWGLRYIKPGYSKYLTKIFCLARCFL